MGSSLFYLMLMFLDYMVSAITFDRNVAIDVLIYESDDYINKLIIDGLFVTMFSKP